MYEKIDGMLKKQKGTDFVVVMRNFNAEVGEERTEEVTGSYALEKKTSEGRDWCNIARNKI